MSLFYHKHQFVPSDRTLEIFFSGCSMRCPNCHNSFLQERTVENTKEVSPEEILEELRDYVSICSQVHILGGEPLEQDLEDLSIFLSGLRNMGFSQIIFFTGWDFPKSFLKSHWELFKHCDFVKTGHYDETQLNTEKALLPDSPSIPLASKNQVFIKIDREDA